MTTWLGRLWATQPVALPDQPGKGTALTTPVGEFPPFPAIPGVTSRPLLPLWRKLVPAWIILGAGSLAFVPILINGFPRGADVEHHYRWSFFFFNALKAGYLYPRWLTDLNHGYGSPVAVYYPPLTFYVSAFFNLISGDTLIALSLSCWLGMVLSGYAMYRFSRNLLSSRLSLLAALFYMLAPYHIFDLYRGNSISEKRPAPK